MSDEWLDMPEEFRTDPRKIPDCPYVKFEPTKAEGFLNGRGRHRARLDWGAR